MDTNGISIPFNQYTEWWFRLSSRPPENSSLGEGTGSSHPYERPLRADARRNRERVLSAARALFAEHGREAQVVDVAKRAGVGVGTVYRHFPDRDALLDAVVSESIQKVAGYAREALGKEDVWAAFSGFLLCCAELSARDRALCETLVDDFLEERWASLAEEAGLPKTIAALVERGKAAGVIRADARAEDVPLIICGVAATTRAGSGPLGGSWRRHLAIALEGLRAPAALELPD